MEFRRATLETCGTANGIVVVIDVVRAFSTAAYAFAAGAPTIALVSTVEEAFALKKQIPNAFTMGEVNGLPIPGFDFGNSPGAFDHLNLAHHLMIQRTSAGTQGVVRSQQADHLFACSFCCASATARYIRKSLPETVTFVITGLIAEGHGDEDMACADYLEALLRGEEPDVDHYVQRVYASPAGRLFVDSTSPEFPVADVEYCVKVNQFDFAMLVRRRDGLLLMETVR